MTATPIPWGRCATCRRPYPLTAKNVVRVHRAGRDNATCDGSGRAPLAVLS